MAGRRGTATSNFGVGRREGHDSSAFYGRFTPPEVSASDAVAEPVQVDKIWHGDARHMDDSQIADNSVALVVTSPPYFTGKEYEQDVGQGHVPKSYGEYLGMLREVFAACERKLEPGGRIAVNVANLGRRPYRSLSADVIGILQDDLRMLLRGEVIWHKAKGAGGNCAWGSFRSPANPVLRDLTERVIIASKGRFDRALSQSKRQARGLPSERTAYVEEFMEATTDVWSIPAESATRVGHPAPFPVELPERLINLYTYRGDLVLDPFMGAGTTAVAAVRTERHYAGFDTDASYIAAAKERVAAERLRLADSAEHERWRVTVPSSNGKGRSALFEELEAVKSAGRDAGPRRNGSTPTDIDEDFQARASREGRKAQDMARAVLMDADFTDIEERVTFPCGVEVNFRAKDATGDSWLFDVSGAFTVTQRPGLRRTDTLWKAIGKASVLHQSGQRHPLVLLTTDVPTPGSAGHRALQAVTGHSRPVHAVIKMSHPSGLQRLASLAAP